ncbi:NADH-quinone oxidoreductase subunit A [Actinomyces sp. MRS3W]|uniref:NADH-quinone oxidoreductase subunit A n=1 Tax=Actinomyces sp. MRS3W TaxID=2800796 RepID=UPI0028FD224C|nr:NADH-quinone oxidoreductase subunit A [Actinomyces sp. MRS3W]MDU0348566.1 NADH-quinone oxidoreductase subunit A [Actinomyces sp. MRS3W]
MNPYVSLLIMAAVAMVIAVGGLVLSAIVSPNRRNQVKVANYECGIDPTPTNVDRGRFPVSFYLVGMTFIIFDVEVVFLYPWATDFAQLGFFGLSAALVFIALITVPYVLEWRHGGLDWD